jgi:RNA polymerase sigma-70 factor (ECF subfamily)
MSGDIDRIFRKEYGRAVAVLVRVFGDIDVAEDAVQDAFATAVQRWPVDGMPPRPAQAVGLSRPPATGRSTACAASRRGPTGTPRRCCFRRPTMHPTPDRKAPCTTTGSA